ncbi:TrkA family potassium uptake protein [Faecalicatena sp. AGMB00832]|uniref:TrkA family potassium uptake protein n=2 Tax=Lachnospiraceae TaxID=186803 RepID=A0ABS6CYD1_9FIRM|nr:MULTISPECIES: TrkA family potassium uptake protein [Faecalicatena]MBU3874245.1 TrkA family potassium uptake protein [Faecalicatena faecalis]MCI6465301.1 TrkA family potassium uptake protein [Faecalicatena sp.]MDY5617537.1 TrkA family potassium uptake protein [Lachnospiraceae bacterium]
MLKEELSESYGIIGLGRFGTALAKKLAEAGREVIVVDRNESKVKELRSYTDFAYVADELTKEVLEEIGIQNCDTVVVCIGEKIDTSILVTLNVVNLGVRRVIAKAISKDQGEVLEKIGAEVVYPERDMALRLAKKMLVSSVMDSISLDNDVEISEVMVPAKMVGKSVEEIRLRQRFGLNIIAVEHGGNTETQIEPDYVFDRGDVLVVIGKSESVSKFEGIILA